MRSTHQRIPAEPETLPMVDGLVCPLIGKPFPAMLSVIISPALGLVAMQRARFIKDRSIHDLFPNGSSRAFSLQ